MYSSHLHNDRKLEQPWWWRQGQKTIGFMSKTTAGHVHHAFMWRPLHNNNAKPPNATFCGGREDTMRNVLFLFLTLDKVLENSTPGETACIWQIEWVQIDPNRSDKVWEDKNLVLVMLSLLFSLPFSLSLLKMARSYLYACWLCFWFAYFRMKDSTDFYDFLHP